MIKQADDTISSIPFEPRVYDQNGSLLQHQRPWAGRFTSYPLSPSQPTTIKEQSAQMFPVGGLFSPKTSFNQSPSAAVPPVSEFLSNGVAPFLTGSLVGGISNLASTALRTHQANQDLEFRKAQYQKDWDAATRMGLSHPSQISNFQTNSIYKLGNRGFTSVPRGLSARSPYGY